MRQTYKTFLLMGITVACLLFMHMLPALSLGDKQLKPVSILSDLSKAPSDKVEEEEAALPAPMMPKADNNGAAVAEVQEVWPNGIERIYDYSGGAPGGMAHFYKMLSILAAKKGASLKRPVRIAYYGDSFIEGDILTADLREFLQQHYGGEGPGWVDAGNPINSMRLTARTTFSGMTEHTVMKKQSGYSAAQAGIYERYYTANAGARTTYKGSTQFAHSKKWMTSRLYFRSNNAQTIKINIDGMGQFDKQVQGSPNVQMIEMKGPMNNITYTMGGASTLYGAGLETDGGIVIDNFSMRGSSGMTLANLPESTLKDFARLRPYDLIVIQFGQNALHARGTNASYTAYMNNMKKVVQLFRKCFPEASILLVSVGDRGQRGPNGWTTIKTLDNMIACQQQAAADLKIGFYNLFHAIGGPGTIVKLVNQGMAAKDYIHINYKGGKVVAKPIFDSMVQGQKNYSKAHP